MPGEHTDSVDSFVVQSGPALSGTVRVGGAKNSVLKLMVACVLAEGRHVLTNVPRITDVDTMAELLEAMGVGVARSGLGELEITTPGEINPDVPYELVERMRASVVLPGALLARTGRAVIHQPGGDDFGSRPIDFHIRGLEALGAEFKPGPGCLEARSHGLRGSRVVLEYPSHTTTDNLLMAAVLAKGTTVIENAAREPEVTDLAQMLNQMGARISGEGTSRLVIEGVADLAPARHRVVPDRVEAATYLAAVGISGGEVFIDGARAEHMDMLIQKLAQMGMSISAADDGLWARAVGRLASVDVATLPYPGVATDYKPLLVTMMTVAAGVGIVSENIFSGRFRYIDELRRMGADITTEGHHAVVRGVERLSGASVRASDIRAGTALVLAGLAAEGQTTVSGAVHVDRGYEDFAAKLAGVGASITRVASDPLI
ncbi:MAG: UDP-N-acetylglucosamine 1-carboxyvinyltransferase [Acidimicrobiales bacterium]